MDWDKLRIFHIVANAGTFTHAGERLNLSQSAISRQIGGLEQDLGAKLFNRHARGLILTSEGELLFKTVQGIFAQITSTQDLLLESQNETKGELRVACSVGFGSIWMPKRLKTFAKRYPNVMLRLVLTDEEVDFSMREADVSIGYAPVTQPSIMRHFLAHDMLQLYGSASYFEEHSPPLCTEDLDMHRLIVYGDHRTPPYEGVNWVLNMGAQTGHIRTAHIAVNNAYAILQNIREGLGIGALPYFIAKDYPDLVPVLPDHKGPSFDFNFMYPAQMASSKKVQVFKDFIVSEMQA